MDPFNYEPAVAVTGALGSRLIRALEGEIGQRWVLAGLGLTGTATLGGWVGGLAFSPNPGAFFPAIGVGGHPGDRPGGR